MEPVYQGIDVTYKSEAQKADNKDIRDLLFSLVPQARAQMSKMAKSFRGRNEEETCRKIFDYIVANFSYVADRKEQVIKLPSALLKYKVGDCKSYALFTAAILENLKIPYKFVFTSYNSNPIPGHVYVTTDGGCIIDAVYGKFNQEKTPTYKYTQNMNVRYMAGIGSCDNYGNSRSYGRRRGVGATGISGGKPVRKIALAPGRGLFLGIVKANLDGFATKLQKVNPDKLKKNWENVGGNYSKLVAAIKVGAGKPAKKLGFLGRLRKRLREQGGVNGIGAANDSQVQAAIIATASALAVAIPAAAPVIGPTGAVLAGIYPVVKDMVLQTPAAEETDVLVQAQVAPENDADAVPEGAGPVTPGTQFDFQKALPLVAVAGAALYLATRKKRK